MFAYAFSSSHFPMEPWIRAGEGCPDLNLRQVYQPPPADILGNFKLPVFATWPWHLREAKFDTLIDVNCVVIHQSII